jgi:hypothetical protein
MVKRPDTIALKARLAKTEALAARAASRGERQAAEAAARRLRRRLDQAACAVTADIADAQVEIAATDPLLRRLIVALCQRYSIEPDADAGDGHVRITAPRVFLADVLMPEITTVCARLAPVLAELGGQERGQPPRPPGKAFD